jgi:hypothetical protein
MLQAFPNHDAVSLNISLFMIELLVTSLSTLKEIRNLSAFINPESVIFRRVRISREKRLSASPRPSFRLSACDSAAPDGRIFVKFYIGDF